MFCLHGSGRCRHRLLRRRNSRTAAATISTASISMQSNPQRAAEEQIPDCEANLRRALDYHRRTKHSLSLGYACGPRGLDWANQPNPFLRFVSSPLLPLLHYPPRPLDSPPYPSIFSSFPSPPRPLSKPFVSRLLYDSLALSAWKTAGASTWSLRVNPSSGNLHPTECHVISPPIADLSPTHFVAHYSPKDHSLQLRAELSGDLVPFLAGNGGSLLLVLSSIFWREAWKYGERALRYCNHDIGHAIAAVAISAAALGWDARLLDGLGHDALERLIGVDATYPPPPSKLPDRPSLGLHRWAEAQHPDCLLALFPAGSELPTDYHQSLHAAASGFSSIDWIGTPNSLSKEHVCWDIIYRTAEAIKKPATPRDGFFVNQFQGSGSIPEEIYEDFMIREVVRKRRSAVAMDRARAISREAFHQILLHCLPSGEVKAGEKQGKQLALPFRTLTWDTEVHMALFVHRVTGLNSGLYFLVRNEDHLESLKRATRPEFEWERQPGTPAGLPLYRLAEGDCRQIAMQLSCYQDIAADGCFSLGMVARFEPVLRDRGAWMYPRLFWETGVLGQVLYLEAHAVGISATGIGCYFDDDVHKVLGFQGTEFQSLYHFTVGGPVLDKRIMSLPAYPGPGIDA